MSPDRETVWAKMGTPGRVVSKSTVEVLVPVNRDGKIVWERGHADIQGMVVLDEPTLEYYQKLAAEKK